MRDLLNLLESAKKVSLDVDPADGIYDVYLEDGFLHLSAVASHRKGGGTKIMDALCAFADEHDLPVELCAVGETQAFYEKFGFHDLGDCQMRREPAGLSEDAEPKTEKPPERPNPSWYRSSPVDHFIHELEQNHMWVQELDPGFFWHYVETIKGKATVNINRMGPDKVELFWLIATQRGAGRGALEVICELADKYGVTIKLDAIPLNGEKNIVNLEQLVRFYAGFGFIQRGKNKEHQGIKYPVMVRVPRMLDKQQS